MEKIARFIQNGKRNFVNSSNGIESDVKEVVDFVLTHGGWFREYFDSNENLRNKFYNFLEVLAKEEPEKFKKLTKKVLAILKEDEDLKPIFESLVYDHLKDKTNKDFADWYTEEIKQSEYYKANFQFYVRYISIIRRMDKLVLDDFIAWLAKNDKEEFNKLKEACEVLLKKEMIEMSLRE
jgi:hypothetical protein